MRGQAGKVAAFAAGLIALGCSPAERAPQRPASGGREKLEWATPAVRAPRLQQRVFRSAAAGAEVSYHIYTPEAYDAGKERRFPVIYWLHGSGGGAKGLPLLARHFDAAIRAGRMPPALVVFPNGLVNGMWCDSKDGRVPMETVVVKELVPHVDASFRTVASREGRLIEGFSMGGYGAARLGFKYPGVFGAVSALGAGPLQLELDPDVGPERNAGLRARVLKTVYGGDQEYFKAQSPWVLAERSAAALRGRTRLRLAIGELDATLEANRGFHEHLERLAIPHGFTVLSGVGHSPMAVLEALGESNWEFYRAAFGAGGGGARSDR
jgi:enterochelin esterase-like enzyme